MLYMEMIVLSCRLYTLLVGFSLRSELIMLDQAPSARSVKLKKVEYWRYPLTRRTFSFIAWVVTDWLNSYLSPAPYKCWILIFPKWNLCAYAIILCDLSPWSVKSIQQKSASEPSPIKNSRNVPLWTLLGSELLRKMLLRTCSLHGAFSISVYYIGDIWLGLHKKM